jgi:hypothetical protein
MANSDISLGIKITIVLLASCEAITNYLIMTIVPFMVEFYLLNEYNGKVPEDIISEYSGFLDSVYRFAQVFAALIW